MPTQEDRMTDLEKNVTILLGIASGQERDIKSIQLGVITLQNDMNAVEGRLYTLEKEIDDLKQSVNSKLDQILLLLNTNKPGQEQQ